MTRTVLQVSDLSFSYRKGKQRVDVLDRIGFSVSTREIVAIEGASGSGKTTLLLSCGGMLRPETGSVVIDGQDLYSLSPGRRNRVRAGQIGYLFQTLQLVPYLTVLDNILLSGRTTRDEALQWLETFELGDRVGHRPDELSHGQRQRIALIRAIAHQPLLLITDEPTGNLDDNNTAKVFNILRHFADSGGAVILASHDRLICNQADRRFHLADRELQETPAISTDAGTSHSASPASGKTEFDHATESEP